MHDQIGPVRSFDIEKEIMNRVLWIEVDAGQRVHLET